MTLQVHIEKGLDAFALDMRLEAKAGLTVLFGDSGAGKSLTLRMVAGLMRPDRGRVSLGERVLFDSDQHIWIKPQERRIGLVFQHESILPHLNVRDNVIFGGRGLARQERVARARELMETFQLALLEDRRPQEISGGQKQRVCLARALMQRPRALLLDEPFSALDLPNRKKMRECLAQAMRELSIPVVLVTHDLVEALSLADRLVIVSEGQVIQQGPPAEVVERPVDERVAALVDLENLRIPFG